MEKLKIRLERYLSVLLISLVVLSCSDFEEVNTDPKVISEDQVQVEHLINGSMNGAQLNPHVAERIFELYWGSAGRMSKSGGLQTGGHNDGWSTDYFNSAARWQSQINDAISVAERQIENGNLKEYTNNLLQVARIWRVYLMSEMADTFGPITINGFQGVNPDYSNLQDIYYFLLEELKDAASKIDESVSVPSTIAAFDPSVYGYDFIKWKKYSNSLRMRLAMRLSEVDASKAQQEFEDAVSGMIIASNEDDFKVFEFPGWNDLSGVMSRPWWYHPITTTLNNLMIGLGGITTETQFASQPDYHTETFEINDHIKAENDLGIRYTDHLPTKTNAPASSYFLDGLVHTIDPRAYKAYTIPNDPGDTSDRIFLKTVTGNPLESHDLLATDGSGAVFQTLDMTLTWNSFPEGDWGVKGNLNPNLVWHPGALPCLDKRFRITDGTEARIFFAAWETHFLIAEAALRGWNVPLSAKAAYEEGIAQNFDYWGATEYLGDYLASNSYNRVGTSVSWDHTTEPPATFTMNYVDGYTNTPGTVDIAYPSNTIYEGGAVKNDHLTKIITQKYIAQTPWLPLEAWSDHRRLGLPFFENPVSEQPLPNLPELNDGNLNTNQTQFFPQRIRYYSGFSANNPTKYEEAVNHLDGPDEVLTSLWWAQK